MYLNGKKITKKPKREIKPKNVLTFFIIFHSQKIEYVDKLMSTLISCENETRSTFKLTMLRDSEIYFHLNKKYHNYHSKFILVDNNNMNSRNNRLLDHHSKIETEYVMVVDGDDKISKTKTEKIIDRLNGEDIILIDGDWYVVDKNENEYVRNFNVERSESGLWVQSYIFRKSLVQKIIESDLNYYVRCYSLSDNILGLALMNFAKTTYKTLESSPYIHREESESSKNSKVVNAGNFWKNFYSNNEYCKLTDKSINGFDDAFEWMSINSKTKLAREKSEKQISLNSKRKNYKK